MRDARSSLLCPACKVDLVMTERKDVEIDYCPKCRGVWLDRGELDKIVEKSAALEMQQRAPRRGRTLPMRATANTVSTAIAANMANAASTAIAATAIAANPGWRKFSIDWRQQTTQPARSIIQV